MVLREPVPHIKLVKTGISISKTSDQLSLPHRFSEKCKPSIFSGLVSPPINKGKCKESHAISHDPARS